jgi:hypothetical protein
MQTAEISAASESNDHLRNLIAQFGNQKRLGAPSSMFLSLAYDPDKFLASAADGKRTRMATRTIRRSADYRHQPCSQGLHVEIHAPKSLYAQKVALKELGTSLYGTQRVVKQS